jgi:pimeloyl-ACP methyl ester carboxylesterase
VQTYAAAHPDRIATLYLDGPVDLTVDGATYLGEAARTFNDTFIATLNNCVAEAACKADLQGRDPLAQYDKLIARAAAGGLALDFPMGDGTTQRRTLTASAIESAVTNYLYSPGDRELLLRALTAAFDGDLVPIARISYAAISVDPDTLQVVPDPTYSDAMYYAVECQDYVYNADAGSEADKLAAFMAAGRSNGAAASRFGGVYYSDMPCLYWPNHPAVDPRPAAIVNAPYPTVVMVATTDPITPVENAIRIANRLSKVNVIIQTGGPHVIFGWGLSCPDDNVAAYMVKGTSLGGPILTCPGSVSDAYVATAADTEAAYKDASAFMASFTDQVENTNDYVDMLDKKPIKMGCDFGGVLEYRPTDTGTDLTLTGCVFTPGMAVSGSGSIDKAGVVKLNITLPGGALRYTRFEDGKTLVTGMFRSAPVAGG